jgi:CRP-like cAMP-binding protein
MSYAQLLAEIPMFSSVAPEDLNGLAALIQRRDYEKGEIIFHEGDEGTALFIIRKGEVLIRLSHEDGKEVVLGLLTRSDVFGELALLDGDPRSADAVAREPTQLLMLSRADFLRFVQGRPQVAMSMLTGLSRLVRHVTQLVHDTAFLDVRARLARVLVELADNQGQKGPDGISLTSKLTQGELANLVGVTRESVNKWLRFYEKQGLLRNDKGRLTLTDPERLREDAG